MEQHWQDFLIRHWQVGDRSAAATVIHQVLTEYGLPWEPSGADRDVLEIETHYIENNGEFWVVQQKEDLVGTAAYYPISRGKNAVEIRKMYLLPQVRGQGLGKYLLQQLEETIQAKGFQEIWIETASILKEAVNLYETNAYLPTTGVETDRCDLVYYKCLNNSN